MLDINETLIEEGAFVNSASINKGKIALYIEDEENTTLFNNHKQNLYDIDDVVRNSVLFAEHNQVIALTDSGWAPINADVIRDYPELVEARTGLSTLHIFGTVESNIGEIGEHYPDEVLGDIVRTREPVIEYTPPPVVDVMYYPVNDGEDDGNPGFPTRGPTDATRRIPPTSPEDSLMYGINNKSVVLPRLSWNHRWDDLPSEKQNILPLFIGKDTLYTSITYTSNSCSDNIVDSMVTDGIITIDWANQKVSGWISGSNKVVSVNSNYIAGHHKFVDIKSDSMTDNASIGMRLSTNRRDVNIIHTLPHLPSSQSIKQGVSYTIRNYRSHDFGNSANDSMYTTQYIKGNIIDTASYVNKDSVGNLIYQQWDSNTIIPYTSWANVFDYNQSTIYCGKRGEISKTIIDMVNAHTDVISDRGIYKFDMDFIFYEPKNQSKYDNNYIYHASDSNGVYEVDSYVDSIDTGGSAYTFHKMKFYFPHREKYDHNIIITGINYKLRAARDGSSFEDFELKNASIEFDKDTFLPIRIINNGIEQQVVPDKEHVKLFDNTNINNTTAQHISYVEEGLNED
jgi:hypothetical protein